MSDDHPPLPNEPGPAAREADAEQDLRATADSIQNDIVRLATVEREKSALDPEDPSVDRLSDEAVRLGERIARETKAERQLSEELG
jgi:hypothetical protein